MLTYVKQLPEAREWPLFSTWLSLVENADSNGMLDFLRAAGPEDRRQVLVMLRAMNGLGRQAQIWLQNDKRYEAPSSGQDNVIALCRFVCYEDADIRKQEKDLEYALPHAEAVLRILPWRQPEWFARAYGLLLEQHTRLSASFGYIQCIDCERLSSLVPSPKAIAPKLSSLLYSYLWKDVRLNHLQTRYPDLSPENLERKLYAFTDTAALLRAYPEILERDVWTLFMEECDSFSDNERLLSFLCEQASTGTLDRRRMLRECLTAANRNLPKGQIGGYPVLFEALGPTVEERMDLKDDLLAVLACPHSKPVTAVLKHLKTIAADARFPHAAFAELLPVLLSSTVKAVQTGALAVAETIAKKRPQTRPGLAFALAPAFACADEGVQTRAANLILACAEAVAPELRADLRAGLRQYGERMLAATKVLLADFLNDDEARMQPDAAGARENATTKGHTVAKKPDAAKAAVSATGIGGARDAAPSASHLDESMRVTPPRSLDELIFMLSEAFVRPEEHHCTSVPEAMFAFRDQLSDETLVRLGPAITAARKAIANFNTTLAVNGRMPAFFFLRWCIARLEASQGSAKGLAALKKKLPELKQETTDEYVIYDYDAYYKSYRQLSFPPLKIVLASLCDVIKAAFARLESGDPLPMLSSVTHAPCWVDPRILAERLRLWQEAGREPNTMDMQLALQRCAREALPEALAAAGKLEGEYRAVLAYLAGGPLPLEETIAHPAWWLTAALARPERSAPPELIRLGFASIPQEYLTGAFTWEVSPFKTDGPNSEKEFTTTAAQQLVLSLRQGKPIPQYLHLGPMRDPQADGAWETLFAGRMFLGDEASIMHQALALYPNNPEPLVMDILSGYGREKYWLALAVFAKLLELRVPQGPASNLFLALGMLTSAREVRLNAAAFWRAKVDDRLINGADVGKILGRLEARDWVPTKRFTDLVESQMMGLGPEHSRQLGALLEALLLEIGPKPPVNIKRILELFYELAAANAIRPDAGLAPLLDEWGKEKPYAAAVKRLRALM